MLGRAGEVLRAYRAAYRNWPSVLLGLALRGRARAATRDGRVVEGDDVLLGAIARLYALGLGDRAVRSFWRAWEAERRRNEKVWVALLNELYALRYKLRCCRLADVSDDLSYIVVNVGGRRIVLYEWGKVHFHTDINDYVFLDVKGKSVLDVGAFVGDSAILFALMGARRVVAIESSPWAYSVAKKNIEINGLSNVVTLVNCAVTREDGKVLMLPSTETATGFRVSCRHRSDVGDVPVPTCTLDSLIERYGPFDVVKMDCEGCEYESIPYSRRIGEAKEILIEYHEGYESLEKKLREEGFKNIKYLLPGEGGKLHKKPVDLQLGLIYASRQQ